MKPKQNKLSPNSNILWSSSFILPEHLQAINAHRINLNKQTRPILDDQQKEELIRTLSVAIFNELEATLTLFEDHNNKTLTGRITRIEKQTKRLKIENETATLWIHFDDVMDVQI